MTLILLLIACATEHKQTVTTSIIGGGGTDTTFYALVLQETYDETTHPYAGPVYGGSADVELVGSTKMLLRCEVAHDGLNTETRCGPALTAKQAAAASNGWISFDGVPSSAAVSTPPTASGKKESR